MNRWLYHWNQGVFQAILCGFNPFHDDSQATMEQVIIRSLKSEDEGYDPRDITQSFERLSKEIKDHGAMKPHQIWNAKDDKRENVLIRQVGGRNALKRLIVPSITARWNCNEIRLKIA